MVFWNRDKNRNRLRVIKTARDVDSINKAAKNGLFPLVKKVQRSNQIRSKFAIMQDKISGEIEILTDYRSYSRETDMSKKVINWTYYYPHNFTSPFAAYLIPGDIQTGERVFLEDLIEDYVGASWNQGDAYRLESCEAIWNGIDFEIQYNPEEYRSNIIG